MRRVPAIALALTLALAAVRPAAAGPSHDWPATPAGERARHWVTAFNTGPDAMRAFSASERVPDADTTASATRRVERYRDLKERYGRLELVEVRGQRRDELTVRLIDKNGVTQDWIFKVEPQAPHRLATIAMLQGGHDLGGWLRSLHH